MLLKAQSADTALGRKYYDDAYVAYYKGKYAKAVKLWLKASDNGYLKANSQLAELYKNGYHVKGGMPKAVEYMTRSAVAGDADAMLYLARLNTYSTVQMTGNVDTAIYWFKKAAALGNSQAMAELGAVYMKQRPDNNKAWYWYKKGSDMGNLTAGHMVLLALKDAEGLYNLWLKYKDVKSDSLSTDEANIVVGLLREASEMGSGRASNEQGIYYSHREHGSTEALMYFERAVKQGFNVKQSDMDFAIWDANNDKNYISPQASKIGTTPNNSYNNSSPGTTRSQHKCPYCNGTGTIETAGSKSTEQDSGGRWQNTYTPRSFSTCSFCKGTGYY